MATPNMNLGLPTVSSTPGPTYAVNINAALTTIDSHNHSSGRGVQIPTSALNINADLSLNAKSLTSIYSLRMVNQAAPLAAGLDNASIYAASGNLYFNNFSGTPVQITAGTAVNAAAFGGWTGDYVAAGAQGKYTAANQSFSLINSNATLSTLYVNKASVGQADGTTLGSQQVYVAGPATVTGTSTLAAVSASGNVSTSGALSVTGTSSLGATNCAALTCSSLNASTGAFTGVLSSGGTATLNALTVNNSASVTGALTVGSTMSSTGAASASALTLTGPASVTTASTAVNIVQNVLLFNGNGPTFAVAGPMMTAQNSGFFLVVPVSLPPACTITGATAMVVATSGVTPTFTVKMSMYAQSSVNTSGSGPTGVSGSLPAPASTTLTTPSLLQLLTMTGGNYAIAANSDVWLYVQLSIQFPTTSTNSFQMTGLTIQVNVPSINPGVRG